MMCNYRLLAFLCLFCSAVRLSAQTAPTISAQPASKTVTAGTSVTFSVTATGSPTYQWEFNGNAMSGATAATFTIASPQPGDAGIYAALVTNSAGSVTSNNASLLVYTPYLIRTLAGQVGTTGYVDATGTAALFSHPTGIATDSSGNVYVADTLNSVIRKVTPAGAVSTLAGQVGVTGSADGTGTAARFYYPSGVAVDTAGNVYVADTFNSTIRKITPAGAVSTLAGTPPTAQNPAPENQGSTNGTGSAARFATPRGVAVDGSGNVYVADTQNSIIRKITSVGVVTTVAGTAGNTNITDGTTTAARFNYPFGIASDSAGNLWVADTSNNTVRAITTAGVVTTLAGLGNNAGSAGGSGSVARFNQPTAIARDSSGNLFVADQNNSTLREILPGGIVVTLAGLAGNVGAIDGAGTSARLSNPYGIAVDGSGNVDVADTMNATLRVASTQPAGDAAPQILTQPANVTVQAGASATFTVLASGTPAPTYQWQKAGVNIAGATTASFSIPSTQSSDGSTYAVIVTNQDGVVTSNAVTLTVLSKPSFSGSSQSQAVSAGAAVSLNANASGGNLSYQWYLNGAAVPGATASTLTLSPVGSYQNGTYTVTATNSIGSTTATVGTVSVATNARLLNLSTLGQSSSGTSNALTVGFFINGGAKNILLRGIGPTLSTFGVASPLANPELTLFTANSAVKDADTTGWASGSSNLSNLFVAVGAFSLPPGSRDSALSETGLAPAGYSAQVQDLTGGATGMALAEIYDADTGTPPARLSNISGRGMITPSASLTGGFVIGGSTSETVVIRGIGPTLASFGVAGALGKPVLKLFSSASSTTAIATNSGWAGNTTLSSLFKSVGAFALPTSSADAAMVQVLAPGNYTAVITSADGSSGVALVEIYEVPGS